MCTNINIFENICYKLFKIIYQTKLILLLLREKYNYFDFMNHNLQNFICIISKYYNITDRVCFSISLNDGVTSFSQIFKKVLFLSIYI